MGCLITTECLYTTEIVPQAFHILYQVTPLMPCKKVQLRLNMGILIAHNHPSGNLKPSGADITLTEKINAASRLMEVGLLDHIILTEEGYFSFVDEGMHPHSNTL